jgi:protein-L-isoaspartate(D-aspartate) O-methyltransferase
VTEAARIQLIMELRRAGITDTAVLGAIERTPREVFVPTAFANRAYDNVALPISHGQTISQPAVVAYMTQELRVGKRHKVLEVGTGSGYQSAILSRLCRRLYSVERHRDLTREAEARFSLLRLKNVTTRVGDGALGWPEQAPFDRILVTAAAPDVPPVLLEQLVVDGIMIVPVGEPTADQQLIRCRRTETGVNYETLWPVRFVPLVEGVPEAASRTG